MNCSSGYRLRAAFKLSLAVLGTSMLAASLTFSSVASAANLECDPRRISNARGWEAFKCEDVTGDGVSELIGYRITSAGTRYKYTWNRAGQILARVRMARSEPIRLAALTDKCSSSRNLTAVRNIIYKTQSSKHIPKGDGRYGGISFIGLRGSSVPRVGNRIAIYDSAGTQIGQICRYYPTGFAYSFRAYSGTGGCARTTAAKLTAKAFTNTGDRKGYFPMARAPGACLEVTRLDRCQNSSAC